jgi:transposase
VGQLRLPVRKIREVLRLKAEGVSDRQIGVAIGSARSTVQECLRRARDAGVSWPLPPDLDETTLHARLYRRVVPASTTPRPDFPYIHAELRRRGVTRLLLWQEYKAAHPHGWQYSVFCDQYRRWLATQEMSLRQDHLPGDKLFVDYAGQTAPVTDRQTGEIRTAQIFVAVLGCSNYTYAEATWTQGSADWLGAHVRALEYFGAAPRAIVPDNLKSGVHKAHRYEPDLNRAYQDFAEHYDLAILPARIRKPRDKAKVEGGVLIVLDSGAAAQPHVLHAR